MNIIKSRLDIGAEKEFNIVHLTDIHLTRTGKNDGEPLLALAGKRKKKYPFSEGVLNQTGEVFGKSGAVLLVTGDMTDFATDENLKRVKEFRKENDFLFVCGNHDFRPFGGMQYDVPEIRAVNLERVSEAYGNDIRFFSRMINGVNLVGIDDCYYRFEKWQLDRLKAEAEKGAPIILALHVPLYTEDCYDLMITEKRRYASLVAVPEEKLGIYPPERYLQQKEDEITREAYDFIMQCKNIKAVICGHVHKNHDSVLPSGAKQLITGTDTARVITVV